MEYHDYYRALADEHPDLGLELAEVRSLESVLAWMKRRNIPLGTVDIINQDEFSLDFLIPLGPDGRHLVFGITWLGGLTAVAVWPGKPSADDLLRRRLGEGWRPTPSRLREGAAVLGHAACLAGPAPA